MQTNPDLTKSISFSDFRNEIIKDYTTAVTSREFKQTLAASGTVTHNMGSFDVIVQLYDSVSMETVFADVVRTSSNAVTVTFGAVPTNPIKVLIIKIG